MAAGTSKQCPAGQWTEFELASGVTSVCIQNQSMSVPVRCAFQADAPTTEGSIVLGPDPKGCALVDEFSVEDGDSVWVKPADHSGLAASVTVIPFTAV